MSPDVLCALRGVRFIAQQIKNTDKDNEVGISDPLNILFWYLSNLQEVCMMKFQERLF